MSAQRRKPPAKRRVPQGTVGPGAGVRASGSVNVSPRFTLFGGGMLNFHFGGGGKGRGRGRGGMLRRVAGLVGKGLQEMRGKPSGGKAPGDSGAQSFDAFRSSRPDLFDQDVPEDDDEGDDGSVHARRQRDGGAR